MLDSIRANGADILDAIRIEKDLTPEIDEKLKAFMDRFAKTFT
jgi:F-type H+-transporting ATPase subunit alpha